MSSGALPVSLEETLKFRGESVVIAEASDLALDGTFGEEWLVVTDACLRVYSAGGSSWASRLDLPLSEVRDPFTDPLIGGGALIATVKKQTIEVVRYTNAC